MKDNSSEPQSNELRIDPDGLKDNAEVTEQDMVNEDIDEELSERDALNQAAEQGIYFKDTYRITSVNAISDFLADSDGQLLIFKTKEDAEAKIATLENPQQYTTAQVRERTHSE